MIQSSPHFNVRGPFYFTNTSVRFNQWFSPSDLMYRVVISFGVYTNGPAPWMQSDMGLKCFSYSDCPYKRRFSWAIKHKVNLYLQQVCFGFFYFLFFSVLKLTFSSGILWMGERLCANVLPFSFPQHYHYHSVAFCFSLSSPPPPQKKRSKNKSN